MKKIRKILIIDDDETTAYLHKRLLDGLKVADEVEYITDSSQALDYVHQHYAVGRKTSSEADLIFLDLEMPGMNGFQFLDKLDMQAIDQRSVSIVMLTTSLYRQDRRRAERYIGNKLRGFIVKPLQEGTIRELMEEMQ